MSDHSWKAGGRRGLAAAALVFVSLAACGCVNWSGDVPRYRQILDGANPTSRPAFDPDGELSLMLALQQADADNESIASRGESYIQALADKMRQAGAFLPTLTLSPSYTLTHGSGGAGGFALGGADTTGSGGSVVSLTGSHQFSLPLNASMSGSLSNLYKVRAAGQTADQRAQQLLDERETILLQVAQSYYTVLKAQRQANVYEHGLAFKSEKVRDQAARLKLGNGRPLDLAQSQADLSATRVSLIQARTDAANARSALARLIAAPAVNGPLTDRFDPPADLAFIEQWRREALAGRQDFRAAARGIDAARANLDAAIREYFPSVSVNFSYFLYNDPTSIQTWTTAFSANIPIFSALSIEADIRNAWSAYRQAGLTESQTRRQVLDDVNESFRNVQNSREKIAELKVEVEAAQRAFDLAERSYQLGSLSNLDRLTQQDNLLTAELNLVSEQFNEKSNYLNLLRAVGKLSAALRGGSYNPA